MWSKSRKLNGDRDFFFFLSVACGFWKARRGVFFAEDDLFGTISATLEMPLWSSIRQVTKANLGRQKKGK